MSYIARSLDAISQGVRGAFRQYMPGTDASLKQNVIYVIAKVQTLLAREYELRLEWIYRQLFLRTASRESIVRMHAADIGVYRKPAASASGKVEGTAAAHQTYPAGVRFISGNLSYVSLVAFTADALGSFTVDVVAETAGAATNRDAGAILALADAGLWPTISEEVTVMAGGLGGGADVEDIEALRRRALKVKANPPQGGALSDYEIWALEVPGVASAWAANFANGIGSIGAWVLMSGRRDGIPEQSDLDAIDTYIADKRIVRGSFFAVAPLPKPVDLVIALSPDTVLQRAAVTAALRDFFDARRPDSRIRPGLPGSPFELPLSWISEVISTTVGEDRHRLDEPFTAIVFQPGELPVLGAVTWVA